MRTSLVVALLCVAGPASAERLTLQRGSDGAVTRDCYVWEESPTYNGNSDTLYVGLIGSTDKVTMLYFDVSALAGARVDEARLVLETYGTSGVEIEIHPLTADWSETEPTWSGFIGNVSATTVARFTPVEGRTGVDLTPLVQDWVRTGANLGFALRQATLTPATTFHSSDSTPGSLRPALEVLFTPPAPLVATPVPALSAACAVPLRYPLRAHAPAANRFTTSAPEVSLDEATGELSWTPGREDRGEHSFTVDVTDGERTAQLVVDVSVQCNGPLAVGVGCSTAGLAPLALLALALLGRLRRD